VLVTDIDWFKKVNDTYGHDIGDLVIKGLGDILRRVKRNTDVVARFGGEEFVVLCEQTDEQGAVLLGERIREELAKTVFHTPNGPLSVTCSVGAATFPLRDPRDRGPSDAPGATGEKWEDLFKAADEALYTSKRAGRDRVTLFVPSPASTVRVKSA
jgi:diguanylate cyclase (GGDEF)-like protein